MDKLQEILDAIYNKRQPELYRVCFGIWNAGDVPYTLYAVLADQDDVTVCGESSYGSQTLEEAIECLYNEVEDALSNLP